MLPRKVKFDPTWEAFVFIRTMEIGKEAFQVGDEVPIELMTVRKRRQLYENNRIWPKGVHHPAIPGSEAPPPPQWQRMSFNEQVKLARTLGFVGRTPAKTVLHDFLSTHPQPEQKAA